MPRTAFEHSGFFRFRLEPLSRTHEVASGLAARVHDPAWALVRQWQFGEFAGQDAGSPVLAQIDGHSTLISAWRPAGQGDPPTPDGPRPWVTYNPTTGPLDALVESEDGGGPDEYLRVEGGAHFVRLLDEAGLMAKLPQVMAVYAFESMPAEPVSLVTLLAPDVPDAVSLAKDLDGDGLRVPGLTAVGEQWIGWWHGVASATAPSGPGTPDALDTFDPHRFEHSADFSFGDRVFHAEEYLGDGLDWFSVDLDPAASPAPVASSAPVRSFHHEVVPSTVRFGGIPADRFWEMEDAQLDFGSTDVSALDTGRLLMIAFAEVYGNDWFLVPLEVPAGSLTTLKPIVVTDSFGATHTVERAGRDNPHWNLFTVTGADDGLLLLPSGQGAVGERLESVMLARDELANLAWAVETSFTDARGELVDRRARWLHIAPQGPPPNPAGSYAVQTIVPDYWLPLVPHAMTAASIRFALVPLLQPGADSKPLGSLLHTDHWVHEEEVPREGALVTRRPVLARWFDGSWHVWVRREKNPSGGESSSGLHFDVVRPSETWP
ncbi:MULTISPECIES: hypothetical protein [unclassified Streptomyces]|uniref:hypothetical protein n=1 Tax=unclassified Streptomyces TaxID=2593676 RepID=UPI002250391C|nr:MULTISPECIES: hypothetical protein [unclassified Streptomyces]MCX5327888.1 hypothetical protein [Streptomyces sp. NBC_00140]MCX5357376.1 hypothetical protein [Streptomyces sp. NBC_00124]